MNWKLSSYSESDSGFVLKKLIKTMLFIFKKLKKFRVLRGFRHF